MNQHPPGKLLRAIIANVHPQLTELDSALVKEPLGPGKWSRIQLLGHLIDSAANNHQRFVRASQQNNLVFPGYQQEEWVLQQAYQKANWSELLELWTAYNRHLAWVIDCIPDSFRKHLHTDHSLDRMAWQTVPADQAVSLDYFIRDYIGHLEHHIRQILPDYQARVIGTYSY